MEITAKLSNLRTAPRKVRQVLDLIRGKTVLEAQSILLFTVNKSARSVSKLLNSAVASAKHEFHLDEANLFILKITADEGPKLKRWHPMSRGRAYPIIKRSSHIAIILTDKKPADKQTKEERRAAKMVKPLVQNIKTEVKKPARNAGGEVKRKTAKKKA